MLFSRKTLRRSYHHWPRSSMRKMRFMIWNSFQEIIWWLSRHHGSWMGEVHQSQRCTKKNGLGCYSIAPSTASRLLQETKRFALVDLFVWTRSWVCQFQVEPAPAIQMIFLDDVDAHDNSKKLSLDTLYRNESKLVSRLISLRKLMTSLRQFLVGRIAGVSRPIKCDLSGFIKPRIK